MNETEKLIEQRDNLRAQLAPHNPANTDIKTQIEKINQEIRAIVARQDAENV